MDKNKVKNGTTIGCVTLLGLFVLYIALSGYKPEDLSEAPIIDTVILNQCERFGDQSYLARPVWLMTYPAKDGVSARIPACESLQLDVYKVEIVDGDKWILVKNGSSQGWVKRSVVSVD